METASSMLGRALRLLPNLGALHVAELKARALPDADVDADADADADDVQDADATAALPAIQPPIPPVNQSPEDAATQPSYPPAASSPAGTPPLAGTPPPLGTPPTTGTPPPADIARRARKRQRSLAADAAVDAPGHEVWRLAPGQLPPATSFPPDWAKFARSFGVPIDADHPGSARGAVFLVPSSLRR